MNRTRRGDEDGMEGIKLPDIRRHVPKSWRRFVYARMAGALATFALVWVVIQLFSAGLRAVIPVFM